jgi:glutaredoxin 3
MTDEPRIKLYGSDQCPFCVAARMLLKKKGLRWEDVPVGSNIELRQRMEALSGGWTIPQILIDEQPIGGFDELYAMDQSGELDRLLSVDEGAPQVY